jgi:hypothetical protein
LLLVRLNKGKGLNLFLLGDGHTEKNNDNLSDSFHSDKSDDNSEVESPKKKENRSDSLLPMSFEEEDGETEIRLGVIDFLLHYTTIKKLELGMKSFMNPSVDRDSISSQNHTKYAERFMKFMENNVFV